MTSSQSSTPQTEDQRIKDELERLQRQVEELENIKRIDDPELKQKLFEAFRKNAES
jgi:hypothetical protein